jgi:hypothetical protein
MDEVLLKIIDNQVSKDIDWYVMPIINGYDVVITVDEYQDITTINSTPFTEDSLKHIASELQIPNELAYELIQKCKIAFGTVRDYLDLPEDVEQIRCITLFGKFVILTPDDAKALDMENYGMFITDIMVDEDPRQMVDLELINTEISRVIDIQFVPVLFSGSLVDAFTHIETKLTSSADYHISPTNPQFYKTGPRKGERIILRRIGDK